MLDNERLRINQKETDNLKNSILNCAAVTTTRNRMDQEYFIVHKNYIYENYNKIPS